MQDWEIPAGGNAPLRMNQKLAWADRLIAVVSPDYVPARYAATEWAAAVWDDPGGNKGAVVPVVVRPTPHMPPLLRDLSRIDLTGCTEMEAGRRLLAGINGPRPSAKKSAFEQVEAAPPAPEEQGPVSRPLFVEVRVEDGVPRWLKISGAVAAVVVGALLAGLALLDGGGTAERDCTTIAGGVVVCGDLNIQQ